MQQGIFLDFIEQHLNASMGAVSGAADNMLQAANSKVADAQWAAAAKMAWESVAAELGEELAEATEQYSLALSE
eukprot:1667662-Prymnesium_polylepis.3